MSRSAVHWRWRLKSALASTISQVRDHGFAAALARGADRPLVLGYHRVVEDFGTAARTEMPSMLISASMFERHLEWLGRRFRFVSLDEIGEHAVTGVAFDDPVVVAGQGTVGLELADEAPYVTDVLASAAAH